MESLLTLGKCEAEEGCGTVSYQIKWWQVHGVEAEIFMIPFDVTRFMVPRSETTMHYLQFDANNSVWISSSTNWLQSGANKSYFLINLKPLAARGIGCKQGGLSVCPHHISSSYLWRATRLDLPQPLISPPIYLCPLQCMQIVISHCSAWTPLNN